MDADIGRAVHYLFEALQHTNDWEVIARLSSVLAELLEPREPALAAEVRALAAARARPLTGDAFMAAQQTFVQGIYRLSHRVDRSKL